VSETPRISLVAPVYNEAGNLLPLVEEVRGALSSLDLAWELVLVDDGSSDGSAQELKEVAAKESRVRPVFLRRNFGQTAAMSAGIDAARGDVIITLDADRQNDPADIPKLLAKMQEGFDVVSGWRKDRQDAFVSRTLPSRIANGLISWLTGVSLHDYGCTLKAYDAVTLKSFRLYGEMHRFLPALCTWRGARVTEVPVNHRARSVGSSKYGIDRTLRVMLDLITVKFLLSFSTKPMHVFGPWGLSSLVAGLGINGYLTFVKLVQGQSIGSRPLLILGVLLMVIGVQLLVLGLISELIVRIYYESQGKTVYELDRVHGFSRAAPPRP
jgi:glycosyltransferase involved in cell wall biosynthesis